MVGQVAVPAPVTTLNVHLIIEALVAGFLVGVSREFWLSFLQDQEGGSVFFHFLKGGGYSVLPPADKCITCLSWSQTFNATILLITSSGFPMSLKPR